MPTTLNNARIVLDDAIVAGSLTIDGDIIAALCGPSAPTSEDLDGDLLIPGLIDLHTDNVEQHFSPRPAVRWPSPLSAVLAYDWQVLGGGITTVLDSLSIGDFESGGLRSQILMTVIDNLGRAKSAGLLRADHYLHLRCELSDSAMIEIAQRVIDQPALRLISVMDHTPGQRQWRDMDIYREYRRKRSARNWDDAEFERYVEGRLQIQTRNVEPNRAWVEQAARARGVPMASHDDTTVADVDQSQAHNIAISEFPTTIEAARRARDLGMSIVMGAPNVVLGGSHSGNVSALDLADNGLLDVLTSDYVPASMLQAAFILAERGLGIPAALALVTSRPARLLGFADRGRIAPGLRADLVRVRVVDGIPVISGLWIAGRKYL